MTPLPELDISARGKLSINLTKSDGYQIFESGIDDKEILSKNSQYQKLLLLFIEDYKSVTTALLKVMKIIFTSNVLY